MRDVCLLTLGCKLNQAETEALARELTAAGCEVFDRPRRADAFVINTCSVTHVADRKSRHLISLARRLSPGAPVIVTGCFAEAGDALSPRDLGADRIVSNRDKASLLPALLRDREAGDAPARSRTLRTRAFVKAQEGCNDACAFCVVPRTRGPARSEPAEKVLSQVEALAGEGVQEAVVTGTQLGEYGRDVGGSAGLSDLISRLLAETRVPRLRISSLQPNDVTPGLLRLWENARLCRHFHIALQSGSDAVLAAMRRRYAVADFRRAVALVREALPEAAITTDVMAGFPGETDEDFEKTVAVSTEIGFSKMHVFPYSRRPRTVAARMAGQVSECVKRARAAKMLALDAEIGSAWRGRFVGREMAVLWEQPSRRAGGHVEWEGLTDNYTRVIARSEGDLRNRILNVHLAQVTEDGLEAHLIG